jgi:hypothetical protein
MLTAVVCMMVMDLHVTESVVFATMTHPVWMHVAYLTGMVRPAKMHAVFKMETAVPVRIVVAYLTVTVLLVTACVVLAMMRRLVQFFWILMGLPATKRKPFASRT